MLKVEDAKVGMMVEIVGNTHTHFFKIGDVVEIQGVCVKEKEYYCYSKSSDKAFFCYEADIKQIEETNMIEEKDIDRLKERDEALEMGFELVLVKSISTGKYRERIKVGNYYVAVYCVKSFLDGGSFSKELIASYETATWFDIQAPKMRQMNFAEIDAYLHAESRSLCRKYDDSDIELNTQIFGYSLVGGYDNLGTLNPDNTFEPLPLIEDK